MFALGVSRVPWSLWRPPEPGSRENHRMSTDRTRARANLGQVPVCLTISAGVSVGADPQRVWDLAVDWPAQREWIWMTTTTGGHGLGATVTGRTGVGPVGFADTMLITQW